jgi:glycosyltransferase involved in cell wall biosynthesis
MNQTNNYITVVIPTYNSAEYIDKTLNSVLNQTVLPEELIISDDGSTDNTIKKVNNYLNDFTKKISIKILQNPHVGPGFARNQGIINATNKWISFLDSDDVWDINKIKEVKKIINESNKYNFITHYENYLQQNNITLEISKPLKQFLSQKRNLKRYLYERNIFSTSAVTLNRSLLIDNNFFDEKLPNAQDYELWLKICPNIRLKVIPKILGTYIQTIDNITSKPYYYRIRSELKIANRYRNYVEPKIFIKKIIKLLLSKRWLNI